MIFGIANSLIFFQNWINNTLQSYFDIFVITCIDDFLVYNNFLFKHERLIKCILN